MVTYSSPLLKLLSERELLYQCTHFEALDTLLKKEKITAYIGIDPTAPSIHAGSLLPLRMVYYFTEFGHDVKIIMGGGTAKIGDPTGKDKMRKPLTKEEIMRNIAGIQGIIKSILGSSQYLNNADWLDSLNFTDFLKTVASYVSVNKLLTQDSIRTRLDRNYPLTFLELTYPLLQGYDFLKLFTDYGCRLQFGGSDQWGNIVSGIELIERIAHKEAYGLTLPLLVTGDGKKMGKTEKGVVWLDDTLFSVYDFWQYWRNVSDTDVISLLKKLTTVPIDEINRLSQLQGQDINEAKIILANEVTTFVHGVQAAKQAEHSAKDTFLYQKMNTDIPVVSISKTQPIGLLDVLLQGGLIQTKGEGRRLVNNGGVTVDNQKITDPHLYLYPNELNYNKILIKVGKKKHMWINRR